MARWPARTNAPSWSQSQYQIIPEQAQAGGTAEFRPLRCARELLRNTLWESRKWPKLLPF